MNPAALIRRASIFPALLISLLAGIFAHATDAADTTVHFNAALAPTGKTYADDSGTSITYTGELPTSILSPRGHSIGLVYSNDGAKDLIETALPALSSGPFPIPGHFEAYGYDRAGRINFLGDNSGGRALVYQNGRHVKTHYTTGLLRGYEIIPGRDTTGRHTGTQILRDNNPIHTIAIASNEGSNQILNLASHGITATPQRDGAGNITGYQWSDGTHTVTQHWTRGPGGRIEAAGSNVPGAPSFDYLIDPQNPAESFDPKGRRLKCVTSSGTWTYTYGLGGQLTEAEHPTLGTFHYHFDPIGRRTVEANPSSTHPNLTDLLNRTTSWKHSEAKTLTLKAHPDARVWFNGVEIQNFDGEHPVELGTPGTTGQWIPWQTLAILEGAGEGAGNPPQNPHASPDAKAAQSGAVWIPPANEVIHYDDSGNRLENAQWDYGWDAKNQLTRARTKNHTTAPQAYDITFTYDSEGRRVKKHVVEYQNGNIVSEKIITYLWDGWDLLYERHQLPSGLTTLERRYLWGPDIADGAAGGAGGLLLIRETKGNTTTNIIPLYDGTGHVVALTDINKNLLATYAYGPFGEKISATGPLAQSNPWRYATKYLDEETGLYYFGHRYFDPVTGQWLSREPLGESESINLYAYCGNDPLNYVDVLGLSRYSWYTGGWIRQMIEDTMMGKAMEYHTYLDSNQQLERIGISPARVGVLDIVQDGSVNMIHAIGDHAGHAGSQAAYAQAAHLNDGGGAIGALGYGFSQFIGTLSGAEMIAHGYGGSAFQWTPIGDVKSMLLNSDQRQQYMTFGSVQLIANATLLSGIGKSAYTLGAEGVMLRGNASFAQQALILNIGRELRYGAITSSSSGAITPLHASIGGQNYFATAQTIDSGGTIFLSNLNRQNSARKILTVDNIVPGMRIDPTNVQVFRGGNSLQARPIDFKIDAATGLVKTTHGLSLDVSVEAMSRFGGAFRIESLPEGLQIIQRGKNLGHFEIVPTSPVTPERFQELLDHIQIAPAE